MNNRVRYKNKNDTEGRFHDRLEVLLVCSFSHICKYDISEYEKSEGCYWEDPTATNWYCIECAGSFYGTQLEVFQHWIKNHMTDKWFKDNIEVWSVLSDDEALAAVKNVDVL